MLYARWSQNRDDVGLSFNTFQHLQVVVLTANAETSTPILF